MPQEEKKVKETIQNYPLSRISTLVRKWSRTPKKLGIPRLRIRSIKLGRRYLDPNNPGQFKSSRRKFKQKMKLLNLLHGLGDETAITVFQKIRLQVMRAQENNIQYSDLHNFIIFNNDFYIFHFEILALLSRETNKVLSSDYRKGEFPFEKDLRKSKGILKYLELPLLKDL